MYAVDEYNIITQIVNIVNNEKCMQKQYDFLTLRTGAS